MKPAFKTLNDAQIHELEKVLETYHMSVEKLDGFFAALHISTELIMPKDCFSYIFGEDGPDFSSLDEAQKVLDLIIGLWNDIAQRFQEELFFPLLKEEMYESPGINDWAQGFLDGVKFSQGFQELLDDETKEGHLVPLLFFAYEHDENPELRPDPMDAEKKEKIFQHMVASVNVMYRYNLQFRQKAPVSKPKSIKVGRNDPCRCGSGKKFKKCCIHLFH